MTVVELNKQFHCRWRTAFYFSSVILLLVSCLSLMAGEVWLWPWQLDSSFHWQILTELRLPRVLAAVTIGASLAVAGAALQVLLRNPLAEPSVLGVSGGASVAVIGLILFAPVTLGPWSMAFSAMLGALLLMLLLVGLSVYFALSTSRLLLIGVALGILTGAVITWAFYFSSDLNLRQMIYWLMGSLAGMSWDKLMLVFLLLPALICLSILGPKLDLLMLGEQQAALLGLNHLRLRWQLILLVSVLVAASVAMAGVIGFIGLVIPHLLRLWLGSENRYLLPLCAVVGGCFLVLADTLARTLLSAGELPVGAVTTAIGAPIFIWMLLKNYA
ncbi:Vitamin B12 import system permease protein BtuC [Vibrio stylophorae]|uniref:Vitamin B12 import system permease protein BtuC n=1 Tax=Vibrio stylophorae TaxID=659351 RepID=A0ABN8DQK0_9VIBR|nr:vitamin B12 ABC transporter permease BtuC [Vibrio stylophorae]CAH0533451.1 Vitamin B12 import system permease protein BtuC [Vibrio stylophorae]